MDSEEMRIKGVSGWPRDSVVFGITRVSLDGSMNEAGLLMIHGRSAALRGLKVQ